MLGFMNVKYYWHPDSPKASQPTTCGTQQPQEFLLTVLLMLSIIMREIIKINSLPQREKMGLSFTYLSLSQAKGLSMERKPL